MFGANRLAFGVLLVWLAGIGFFFAFHPGGVQIFDPALNNGKGGQRTVKNPAEVLGYLMAHHFGDNAEDPGITIPKNSGAGNGGGNGSLQGGPLTGPNIGGS